MGNCMLMELISYDFRVYLELKCITKTKGQEGVNAFKVFKDSIIVYSNNLDNHKSKAHVDISRVLTKQNSKWMYNKLLEWKNGMVIKWLIV